MNGAVGATKSMFADDDRSDVRRRCREGPTNGPGAGNYMTDDQSTYWTNQPNTDAPARRGMEPVGAAIFKTGHTTEMLYCHCSDWLTTTSRLRFALFLGKGRLAALQCPLMRFYGMNDHIGYESHCKVSSADYQLTQINHKLYDYSRNCLERIRGWDSRWLLS